MNRNLFLLLTLLFSQLAFAQVGRIKHDGAKPIKIVTDELGQVYVIDEESTITKYTQTGEKRASYSNRKLANVDFDASNVFQLTAYYEEFRQLHLLNTNLDRMEQIDLNLPDLDIRKVVTIPDKTGFWLLDANSNQIKTVSIYGKMMDGLDNLPSGKITDFFTTKDNYYIVAENQITEYTHNWEEKATFPTQDIPFVAIYRGQFIGQKEQDFLALSREEGQYVPFKFPFDKADGDVVFFSNDNIFVVKDNVILVY
jgi:hypothetical protein